MDEQITQMDDMADMIEGLNTEEVYLAPEKEASAGADAAGLQDAEIVAEEPMKSVFVVSEIPELREENRKVFRMSDGSEQAVFYPEAVHVFNEDTKKYENVDNTFAEEEDGRHFRNGRNRFIARFSREENNDELFSVEKGMHSITAFVRKNGKQRNQGVQPRLQKRPADSLKATLRDTLLFEDVMNGADVEYSVTGNGVKENILVREKTDVYRYPFTLDCRNVSVEYLEEEKRVAFSDPESGDEVFCIPAPFMSDANGEISTGVFYEVKPASDGRIHFTVIADSEWMNQEERAFPVTIDPQVTVSGGYAMSTYSWNNGSLYSSSLHTVGTVGNGDGSCNASRMYMKFTMPTLPRNPRIKKAELKFLQSAGISECGEYPKLALHALTGEICVGNCTPVNDMEILDFEKMKTGHCENGEIIAYTFDVTALADRLNKGEASYAGLVMKMTDEESTCRNNVTLYGSADASYAPTLCITYESSYGVNTSYRTHSHELGRFGQGSIDLQCGNLMFDSEDFAWGGNRMPVTIRRLYNSALSGYQYTANSGIRLNTADFSAMKLGRGWKLNLMQSMLSATFQHEGFNYSGYVYVDENGAETYFKKSAKTCCCTSNTQCYNFYEDVNGGETLYDPCKNELMIGSETYRFDDSGRLVRITDEYGNHRDITYTAGRITSVTDGAGRDFGFSYDAAGYLTAITAPDNTSVCYGYTNDTLSSVRYPDGKTAEIASASYKPTAVTLKDADGAALYRVAYAYSGDRLQKVTEYGVEGTEFVTGASSAYSYSAASGRTIVEITEPKDTAEGETADRVVQTVYTFDDDGGVVSQYMVTEDGSTGVDGEKSGINPYAGDGGAGVVSNADNLLLNHGFMDDTLSGWNGETGNDEALLIKAYAYEPYAKYGKKVLRMQSYNGECTGNGVYQDTITLPAGEYAFSAYLRVLSAFSGGNCPGAYLRVTKPDGTVLAESERLTKYDADYVRLIAPFTLGTAQSVRVHILADGAGTVYADAAQLENNPFANAYNLVTNGGFERGETGWDATGGVNVVTGTRFNMSRSLQITGDLDSARLACQNVDVKTARGTKETFTLSGWAKGYGIVNREREGCPNPQFRLRVVIKYYDSVYREYGLEEHTAEFSPCTEEWQFASVQFSKEKYRVIQYAQVYCDYSYNCGTAYFDNIQLTRNSVETGLSASDFVTESTGGADEGEETAAEAENTAPVFGEKKDAYGNALTETTFTDGEFGTIYRSFGYSAGYSGVADAGNNLIRETDARGNAAAYTVDEDTSRNEEVTDRCGNKTAYEYDAGGKTTKVTSKKADGTAIAHVAYTYDGFDNLTEIARGDGLKYVLAYNAFHNLESIGIDGKTDKLVAYTYKNGNGRLKEIAYANGHTMKAAYNGYGQMVSEKWYENAASATPTAHYQYVYDGKGNIVRSIDITRNREYTYTYEDEKLMRAAEFDITVSNGIVTGKTLVNSVLYSYDSEGKLTRKRVVPAAGDEQVIYYENPENENPVVKFSAGGRTVTSHSKTDSFGRKVFDELQLGTGFVSRQFSYHAGQVTDEHVAGEKLKSSPTTNLVRQITMSDGRTLAYEYDAEERITKVTDSVDGVTEYVYDELGQLVTEKHKANADGNAVTVNAMTYDGYGNILSKNGKAYTYGDTVWKDRLTAYDGQAIVYDAQGNPTSYLGHTLTWEKGRQLKSFDGIRYTYNASGIRASKTVNGVTHTYTLDGTKILKEAWGGNTLVPLYDNEDSVCGVIYNGEPFYFFKNLQGDILAIADKNAQVVAKYSYDAWGVCTVEQDTSTAGIASVNPFRYRGYYFDAEIGMYYLQSRYYDPAVGRFVNADVPVNLGMGGTIQSFNLFAYVENNPISMADEIGYAAINVICAAIGAVVGWFFGDWVAKKLGYSSGWKYWAIRAGVVVGGIVIGWFAGTLISKLIATYLKNNPATVFKICNRLGASGFKSAMEFLGINPFTLAIDGSKFIAIARLFNTKTVTLAYDWAVKLYDIAKRFGYRITLDSPHNGYGWHIHLNGGNGKFNNLHIQIVKSAWDYLKKIIK